jgi:hypothetical protein
VLWTCRSIAVDLLWFTRLTSKSPSLPFLVQISLLLLMSRRLPFSDSHRSLSYCLCHCLFVAPSCSPLLPPSPIVANLLLFPLPNLPFPFPYTHFLPSSNLALNTSLFLFPHPKRRPNLNSAEPVTPPPEQPVILNLSSPSPPTLHLHQSLTRPLLPFPSRQMLRLRRRPTQGRGRQRQRKGKGRWRGRKTPADGLGKAAREPSPQEWRGR